ncbi:hypothetical protein DEV91_11891 [Phyllobacterium brassicacearum]|nr:hypothetical protein DEV91_11891 [Phyllobacterium brassicacearum]
MPQLRVSLRSAVRNGLRTELQAASAKNRNYFLLDRRAVNYSVA